MVVRGAPPGINRRPKRNEPVCDVFGERELSSSTRYRKCFDGKGSSHLSLAKRVSGAVPKDPVEMLVADHKTVLSHQFAL